MSVMPRGVAHRGDPRTILLYGIAAFLMLLIGVGIGMSLISTEINRRRWIEHSYEVIRNLDAVLNDVTEAESGQRGFINTGNTDYLRRYGDGCGKLASDLDRVAVLVSDNSVQTARLNELRRQVTAKIADMNTLISLAGIANWPKLMAYVKPGTGLKLMDAVRGTLSRMSDEEFRLLQLRTDSALRLNRWILPAAGSGLAVSGFVLLLGLRLNRVAMARWTAAEDAYRQSERRFRVLVDRISDYGIVMLDPSGIVMSWNLGAERLHGYQAEEIVGKHFSTFYSPEDRALGKPDQELKNALDDGHCEEEGWRARKDGTRFWASISVTAMRDDTGTLLGFAKVSRDLTERKRVADALHEAKELAEASTQAKSTFLATMSHELRTPMTGVLGMIELLQTNPPAAETQLFLDTLRNSAISLMTVLGDILDLSKIEADRIVLEQVDFNVVDLVSTVLTLFMPQASSKGLTLKLATAVDRDLAYVRGDPNRLRQVISNLINNAIKFTNDGSVEVRLIAPLPDAPAAIWQFEICDTEIGMSADESQRIFDSFSQADASTARRFGGTGLGLAISKRIVELMGGTIAVESTPGAGSRFRVGIPFAPGTPEAVSDADATEPADLAPMERSLRILVAEDNPVNQLLCSYMLQQMGHEVTSVGNGREAVDAVASMPFDVILMDMQMPEMDGPEATRHIRDMNDPMSRIPIIGLTADVTVDNRERYEASGLSSFVTKPINPRRLRAELEAVITLDG